MNQPSRLETRDTGTGQREQKFFALQIKAASDDGIVEGYGSVFGVRDSYDDVIAAGAFTASLAAHRAAGTMPAMLWQHDSGRPCGVWTEMVEDQRGLRIVGQLAIGTPDGKNALEFLKIGALNGLSIGFMSKQWAYDRDTDVRTLTEIDLWEVSIVTFPANTAARVTNIKAAIDEINSPKDAERALREAGYAKPDATAFVSRVMRMGESRREAVNPTAEAIKAAQRLLTTLKN